MVVVGVCARCKEPIDNERDAYIIDEKGRLYHAAGIEYEQETLSVETVGRKRVVKARIRERKVGKDCYRR
ncbi:MAG: hypothetical protein QXV23_02160 [Candidatus Bathyarchaeia archaeon]